MKKSTKITLLVAGTLAILVGIIGITYAFFSTGGSQEQANTFTSGCLNISLTDASSSINLTNTYPITDIEGLETTSYDFTIENTCSTSTNYSINLESLNQVSNSLSADYIKVALSSDTVGNVISILSDNTSVTPEIDNAYESYNLYTGTLGASETKTYHLKLWIDYDATVEEAANKVYQSKINVIANPETQVVDNLEATFELNDTTLTSNLTSNVTSATYCTTTDNICTPSTTATISNNSYVVELEVKTKEVGTTLGSITVNEPTAEIVCTTLNETSKVICSNTVEIGSPNFNKTAQANCTDIDNCEETNGIYEAQDDYGTSYYFRGAVTNNYVQFAGYYWRIIRINGDGSIRVIYDGTEIHANGESSEDRQTQTSSYNNLWNYSYHIGYTYEEGLQRPNIQNSGTASTIKGVLDSWYTVNIANKGLDDKVISTSGFCNDRNMASGYSWSERPSSIIYYVPSERLIARSPTLKCNNNLDLYTTKIGLITMDELLLAGSGISTNNNSYYLYTGQNYWTISPAYFNASNDNASVFAMDSLGNINSNKNVGSLYGVRPVINLSVDITLSGTGTMDNPYVIA